MTSGVDGKVVKSVRGLYKTDEIARRLFDKWAERERDATTTSIDRLTSILGISREEAVGLAQRLQEAGCGQFIVGRRGYKSRFAWEYSCISLGQVASGETSELEEPDNPIPEAEEEMPDQGSEAQPTKLTIAEAKRALSLGLEVPETSIEIFIRA